MWCIDTVEYCCFLAFRLKSSVAYSGILFSHIKDVKYIYDVDKPQKHYTKSKKPDTKGHRLYLHILIHKLYDSISMKYLKQANP